MHFDHFLRQACPSLELNWRKYRRRAARHRVQERMGDLGLTDYAEYLERLRSDPEEAGRLPEVMRVTVSRFFRDRSMWIALRDRIFPELLAAAPAAGPVRAWSVGCCGGEEPYSLALLWLHHLQPCFPGRTMEILATDLDEASLERARQGIYRQSSLREVPAQILDRWFRPEGDLRRLDPRAGQLVRLDRHDFMQDPLPGSMDLVLARYLPFTYYRGERRLKAARRLWQALRAGGALMIGAKEELDAESRKFFSPWPQADGFFRKGGGSLDDG